MHVHWFSKVMNDKLKSRGNTVRLNVPYKSQIDNKFEPFSTCNVTSLAMCLEYYDIGFEYGFSGRYKEDKNVQLEDELYQYSNPKSLS